MPDNKYWLGFDLGGTKMFAAVFDSNFKALDTVFCLTNGKEGMEAAMGRMSVLLRKALAKAHVDAAQLSGIGVGAPGLLDLQNGIMTRAGNLGWINAPLRDFLEKEFNCPAVVVNDVDAGVYGEYRFGAGKGGHCVLGVFPGTGIGGGCVYEGNIIHGRRNSVMEVGHIQVMNNGPLCCCGRTGCVEAVSSRLAIAAAAATAARRGVAPWLLEHAGTDIDNITSTVLSESIRHGDAAVELIVRQAAQWLGVAVGNIVNLLEPDIIVLGGGLVEAMPDIFRDEVFKSASDRALPDFAGGFRVEVAMLGDFATAQGAAAWAESRYGQA